MVFKTSGTLTTDKRETAISETWDSQTEWEAYQSINDIQIENGVVKLDELSTGSFLAHWDVSQQTESDGQTIDPLVDQSGNGNDATAVGAPTMDIDGFNGNQAAVLDGSNDRWDVDSISWPQPFTVYTVIESTNGGTETVMRDSNTSFVLDYFDGSNWRLYAGSEVAGSSDTGVNILAGVVDGANSVLEEDDATTNTGDAGTGEPVDMGIGARYGGLSNPFQGDIMEIRVYDQRHESSTRSSVFGELATKWGVTL